MRDFEVIIDILKKETNTESNKKLAKLLGIGYTNLRKRKMDNNIPFKQLFIFCHDRDINIHDVLMTGGNIQASHNKTETERIFEAEALKAEVVFLKRKLTASTMNGKKAIQKARFDIEFIIKKAVDEALATNGNTKEIDTHKKHLERGKIHYAGYNSL